MSNFEERMADAEFNIRTPLCKVCKNREGHEFDNKYPLKPTLTCKIYGEIPRTLKLAREHICQSFVIDMEEYQIFKDLMPKII